MEKYEIRKEFFKLKTKGHTNNQCRKILFAQFGYEVCKRTLQRWNAKLNKNNWDLIDKSRRPKTIYYKTTLEIEEKVISLKQKTGWGAEKIENFVNLGHTTINKILNKHSLTKHNPNRKK